jgi:diguanylate cyclase (GGDEF)-like protein
MLLAGVAGVALCALRFGRGRGARRERAVELSRRIALLEIERDAAVEVARMANMTAREIARITDRATGLPDARYFEPALDNRVAVARRLLNPLCVVLCELIGDRRGDGSLLALADVVRATMREADTACLLAGSRIGLILEDTPEWGGVLAVERLRAALERAGEDGTRLTAGVAAYPSHALDSTGLLSAAASALDRARNSGSGQVSVANTD